MGLVCCTIEADKKFVRVGEAKGMNRTAWIIFTVVPCILILSKSFIYQLMHNRVALKEY